MTRHSGQILLCGICIGAAIILFVFNEHGADQWFPFGFLVAMAVIMGVMAANPEWPDEA